MIQFLEDARDAGYSILAVSGGEPLMYRGLPEVLTAARDLGYLTTVTSNGTLATESVLRPIIRDLDLLALSLDGVPTSHDRMRNSSSAFDRLNRSVTIVRRLGIPFAFVFTLTQWNLNELDWVFRYALERGARQLQIHPLEPVGRAAGGLASSTPDWIELAYSVVELVRTQAEAGEQLHVHLDVADQVAVREQPSLVRPDPDPRGPFAAVVSPLVLEPDGMVSPNQFGLSRQLALGNIHASSLTSLIVRWRESTESAYRDVIETALCSALSDESRRFFNWFDHVRSAAERPLSSQVGLPAK